MGGKSGTWGLLSSALVVPVLVVSRLVTPAGAVPIGWTGNTDQDWSEMTNWNPMMVPGSGDDVTITDTLVPALVDSGYAALANTLAVGGPYQADLVVTGASTLDVTSTVTVGRLGPGGKITVQSSSVLTSNGLSSIGYDDVGVGEVIINGAGSEWDMGSNNMRVGDLGVGTLRVQTGALVSNFTADIAWGVGSVGHVFVEGPNALWDNSRDLRVGGAGVGTLMITNGGAVENRIGLIGQSASGRGEATVSGANSTWTHTLDLIVGNSGVGTLLVEAGGMVESVDGFIARDDDSRGTATITGMNSTWDVSGGDMSVGRDGIGELNIADGGKVLSTNSYIGVTSIGDGKVTVTDPGSLWDNTGELYVGNTSTGQMTIANGGRVNSLIAGIGYNSLGDGSVVVTGAGSLWDNNASTLWVGYDGAGELSIEDGGEVSDRNGQIAANAGSTGTVTVTGSGSEWNNGLGVYVGGTSTTAGGAATLNVGVGGTVNSTIAGMTVWGSGTVNLNGGTINTPTLTVASGGVVNLNAGTLNLTNQNLVIGAAGVLGSNLVVDADVTLNVTNTVTVDAGSQFVVLGEFSSGGATNNGDTVFVDMTGSGKSVTGSFDNPAGATVTVVGDITFADGFSGAGEVFGPGTLISLETLEPGDSAAAVSIENDLELADTNTLLIELGGLTAGSQHDQINAGGAISLDGELDVSVIGGFVPDFGDSFQVLTAGDGVTGTFDTLSSVHLLLDATYNANDVTIEVTGFVLPGDFDLDGDVDLDDYDIVSGNMYTSGAEYGDGDANGDGLVDFEDFVIHALHFGETNPEALEESLPGAGALPGVPEPGVGVLVAVGLIGVLRRGRWCGHGC